MPTEDRRHDHDESIPSDRGVSRREFLKIAGIAGAAVGMGAGMGGLLAACGEEEETTTTAGGHYEATTTGAGDHDTAASSTTVATGAEAGPGDQGGVRGPDHRGHRRVRDPRQVVCGTLE